MSDHELQAFTNEDHLNKIWRRMTAFASLVAILTMVFLLVVSASDYPILSRTIAAGWFLVPPAWFVYENTCLLLPQDVELKKERMARFRLGQDSAKMAWFGIAALIIYFTKF